MPLDSEQRTIVGSEDMLRAASRDVALTGTTQAPQRTDVGHCAPFAHTSPDIGYGDPRTVQQIAESTAAQAREIVS